MGSWEDRGNQYIQLFKILYGKLSTNSKQLPAFPLEVGPGTKPDLRGGRRECYHSATMALSLQINQVGLVRYFDFTLIGTNDG